SNAFYIFFSHNAINMMIQRIVQFLIQVFFLTEDHKRIHIINPSSFWLQIPEHITIRNHANERIFIIDYRNAADFMGTSVSSNRLTVVSLVTQITSVIIKCLTFMTVSLLALSVFYYSINE